MRSIFWLSALAFACSEVWSVSTVSAGVARLIVNHRAVGPSLTWFGAGLLPSAGVTRPRRYYEPIRHLPRPAPTLSDRPLPRSCRLRAPRQSSLVAPRFSPHVLPPPPRWDRQVRVSLASPAASAFPVCMAGRLPRRRFEACSVFTRVAARAVRCPPEEVFSSDASGHSSPPDPSEVLPAGARAAGWGSNPPHRGTFGQGTHTKSG